MKFLRTLCQNATVQERTNNSPKTYPVRPEGSCVECTEITVHKTYPVRPEGSCVECAEISSKTYPVWPEGSAVECVEITVQKPTQFGLKVAVRSVQKSHFKNLPSLACSAWTVAVRATRSADSCVTTGSRGPWSSARLLMCLRCAWLLASVLTNNSVETSDGFMAGQHHCYALCASEVKQTKHSLHIVI